MRALFTLMHIAGESVGRILHEARESLLADCEELAVRISEAGDWAEAIEAICKIDHPIAIWLKSRFPSFEHRVCLSREISEHLRTCAENGATYLTMCDSQYPDCLRDIPYPPLALTCLGNIDLLAENLDRVSIVGSRRASWNALDTSYCLAQRLSENSVCVVSGGAYGVDLRAHMGAIRGRKGGTIVVFASGMGYLYPKGNLRAFSEILKAGGMLLSERLWTKIPRPEDFPNRNRIISGLAPITALVHAAQRSGALSTAHHALKQGREIFVLAADPNDLTMDGNRSMICDGAEVFHNVEEFMSLYDRYRFAGMDRHAVHALHAS